MSKTASQTARDAVQPTAATTQSPHTDQQPEQYTALHLTAQQIISLPPELRDQLLDYLRNWSPPQEQFAVAQILREAHGPLLFLLDYLAGALLHAEQADEALDVIERRQRRSTTIASQAIEAKALLATGHVDHALAVAEDIAGAYPRNPVAVRAAAEVYSATGDFDRAHTLIEGYLAQRPNDVTLVATLARLAYAANQAELARDFVRRLGTGVPSGLDDRDLPDVVKLHEQMGNDQSAKAIALEIERRRVVQFEALGEALRPFTDHEFSADSDFDALYRHLNGPEAIDVTRDERRKIQVEAARHFGFMGLREGQTEAIAAILRQESILAVMPTGAGKSLCYQLPALMSPKPTLVISPLIALMKDQVESLPRAAQRQATFINSTLTEAELNARLEGVAKGEYKLIYAAPERLRQRPFLRALRNAGLALFVVDEAHCVSLWGHDFRPDYLFIQEARHELGDPPALAMTATAPPRVRDEIVDYISATGNGVAAVRPRVMALDIFRDNLHLSAIEFHNEEEKLAALLKFVGETEGSGIVYVNSRHKAESLAIALRNEGIAAEAYHAGIEGRGAIQDRFMSDKTRVVVATIAFGMGIDKRDIRFIVHFHPSRSLAAYYQEVGRAGRDGKPSQGVMFYSNNDWSNLRRWAKADEQRPEFLEKVYAAVATQLGVHSDGEDAGPAHEAVLGMVDIRRLQQVLNADETTVRVAVSMLERADLLTRGFDVPKEIGIQLPRKISAAAKQDENFTYLLRGLALGPGQNATFKTTDIAEFMDWSPGDVEANLLDWELAGYLSVTGSHRVMQIELPPRPDDMLDRLQRLLSQATAVAQRRIDDVVGYATSESCRHGYISAHFGSPPRTRCEVCDNCTGVRPDVPVSEAPVHPVPDDVDIEPMIIDCLISLPKPVGRSGLARILAGSLRAPVTSDKARHHGRLKGLGEAAILEAIDDLLGDNRLRQYERQGYPVLAPTMRGRIEAESWLAEHPELAAMGEAPTETESDNEADAEPSEGDKYTALQKAIWLWRRRSAEEQGQPPYMIMSNELILRIAETRPQTLDELAQLPGMGAQRLEYYGPTLLDLIHLNPPQPNDETLLAAQRAAAPTSSRAPTDLTPKAVRKIHMKLQEIRQKEAVATRGKPYQVASNTLLKAIAGRAPTSRTELEAIPGYTESGLSGQTDQILTFIAAVRQEET